MSLRHVAVRLSFTPIHTHDGSGRSIIFLSISILLEHSRRTSSDRNAERRSDASCRNVINGAALLTLTARVNGNVSSILLFSEVRIRTVLLRVFAPSCSGKSRNFRRANLHLTTEYHHTASWSSIVDHGIPRSPHPLFSFTSRSLPSPALAAPPFPPLRL